MKRTIWTRLVGAMALLLLATTVRAAEVFVVSDGGDDGPGTLREAMRQALASGDDGVVVIDESVPVVTLTSGTLPVVERRLLIRGAGNVIRRDPEADAFRILHGRTTSADLYLEDLTLENGGGQSIAGGAIYMQDTTSGRSRLTLYNVTIRRCTASLGGAIGTWRSDLTIIRSVIEDNRAERAGGGIYHRLYGQLSIDECTVRNNVVTNGEGGGIYINSNGFGSLDMDIRASTISGNRALGEAALGGGILHRNPIGNNSVRSLRLNRSTVSGNVTEGRGGGIANVADATYRNFGRSRTALLLDDCTVTGNEAAVAGGGIYLMAVNENEDDSTLRLEGSIVAANRAGQGPDLARSGETAVLDSEGENLVGDNSGIADLLPAGPASRGDLVGSAGAPIDPKLGPLAINGGFGRTHRPLDGSPAIDAFDDPADDARDQRGFGFLRPSGEKRDAGAVEIQQENLVANARIRLNFRKPGRDTVKFALRLPLGTDYDAAGRSLRIVIGGKLFATLDDRGRAKNEYGTFRLKRARNGDWTLKVSLAKGDHAEKFEFHGLRDGDIDRRAFVPFVVNLDDRDFEGHIALTYRAKEGRRGTGKAIRK